MLFRTLIVIVVAISSMPISANQIASSFGHYTPEQAFPDLVSTSFYIEMRDGVKIAVNVERPAKNGQAVDGQFPVIWHHSLSASRAERDGTGGSGSAFNKMPSLAKFGYVVVQVARRGNGQSFGVRRGYHDRNEAQDAYEITQWLAEQPWSDGNVGLYGCSNTGDAALHAMTVQPPALKAVFAGCFSWHKFDAFRRGGIFAQWGTGAMRTIEEDMKIQPLDGDEDKVLLRHAAEEHQLSTNLLAMWKSLPYRDSYSPLVGSRFWSEGSNASYLDQIKRSGIPLYVLGGWHDELRDQGMITFLNIPNTRVVMGPWQHCVNDDFPLFEEIHRFFDYHLKGLPTGIKEQPKIHYFTMQGGKSGVWKASDQWPLANHSDNVLYLAGTSLKPTVDKHHSLDFMTKKETTCQLQGPFSQPCSEHEAGLSYVADKLEKPLVVTGHPVVDMWIDSSTDDANIFAYLEDIAPDGKVTVVTEGRLKASMRKEATAPWKMPKAVPWHRNFVEDSQPLIPHEAVNLRFDMLPTSWEFKKGHRIQVSVTGSDYRERLRAFSEQQQKITIYSGKQYQSQIILPIEH